MDSYASKPQVITSNSNTNTNNNRNIVGNSIDTHITTNSYSMPSTTTTNESVSHVCFHLKPMQTMHSFVNIMCNTYAISLSKR